MGKTGHRPLPRWLTVDCRDGRADGRVRQGKNPSDPFRPLEVQTECLDKDHAGKMLGHQGSTRLSIRQLAAQAIEHPAHRIPLVQAVQVHDGRQQAVEHFHLRADEVKMASEDGHIAPRIQGDGKPVQGASKVAPPILGWMLQVTANQKFSTVRKKKAIASLQVNWILVVTHPEPARASGDGVALYPFICIKSDRPATTGGEPSNQCISKLEGGHHV